MATQKGLMSFQRISVDLRQVIVALWFETANIDKCVCVSGAESSRRDRTRLHCCSGMEILTSRSQNLHGKYFITARQRSCGKLMFSVVFVHHSVHGTGKGRWSHVTITHNALDLTVQVSFLDMEPHYTGTRHAPHMEPYCTGTPW